MPLPNTLCSTLSPGLYCWVFGSTGVGGVFCDGAGGTFFDGGVDGGTVGEEYEPVRGDYFGGVALPGLDWLLPYVLALPLPKVRPVSRGEEVS